MKMRGEFIIIIYFLKKGMLLHCPLERSAFTSVLQASLSRASWLAEVSLGIGAEARMGINTRCITVIFTVNCNCTPVRHLQLKEHKLRAVWGKKGVGSCCQNKKKTWPISCVTCCLLARSSEMTADISLACSSVSSASFSSNPAA